MMLFSFDYELAREIHRDRLARAERARWLTIIQNPSISISAKWTAGWKRLWQRLAFTTNGNLERRLSH